MKIKLIKFHHIALWIQMVIVCCLIGLSVSDHFRVISVLENIEAWINYSNSQNLMYDSDGEPIDPPLEV